VNALGAEKPLERPLWKPGPLCGTPIVDGTVRGTPLPTADRGGTIPLLGSPIASGLFLGFGRRGGTRLLKLATTSGGEFLSSVGWDQVLASGSSMDGSTLRKLTLRIKP
jgi:hypothetical protein